MSDNKTFESSLQALEACVARLEQGEISLDEALVSFEEGIAHLRDCREIVDKAEERIEVLLADSAAEELLGE